MNLVGLIPGVESSSPLCGLGGLPGTDGSKALVKLSQVGIEFGDLGAPIEFARQGDCGDLLSDGLKPRSGLHDRGRV